MMRALLALAWALVFGVAPAVAVADLPALVELRYCGAPVRNADGSIHRSRAVLAEFQRVHPCPATGLKVGACPGWAINHVVPLACGGCDAVSNLDWMPDSIKSCADPHCRDRFERKVYAADPPLPDTANCRNVIVK